MRARLQSLSEIVAVFAKASPEQRESARRMTYNVQQCVRQDALLAEREVLELIEAMLIQAAEQRE